MARSDRRAIQRPYHERHRLPVFHRLGVVFHRLGVIVMTSPMSAREILDREFLEIRAELLRIAASLDRMDRGDGSIADDPRLQQLLAAVEILQSPERDRAEKLQMLFSLPFDEDWAANFGLTVQRGDT